jgi:predicted ATPase/DNA-binding SARP family transcriptional activator
VTGQPAPVDPPELSRCRFAILGPFEIRRDGVSLPLPAPMARAVLVVLLLHANRVVSVGELCDELWQEHPPASARSALHVHIAALRRALEPEAPLHTRAPGYLLELDDDQLDARQFERQLRDARLALAEGRAGADDDLRRALALWRGPALAEFGDLSCARDEAARLEEQRLVALESRIDADLAAGRHADVVAELQQLTVQQPFRERLHGQLMLALYRSGRQAEALDAYQHARAALVDELGIEPGGALSELQAAILAHDPGLDAPGAAGARVRAAPSMLPEPTSELFGRDADIDRLTRIVSEPKTRLVTLVGPGGVGKTALAVETARRLSGDFTDGARLVELAPLPDARELASAVTRALDAPVREGEPPKTALLRFLGDRHLLLVLDNFEHLHDGAPLAGELLTACPNLTVLVTSREPTRLGAERLYPVRPLDVPAPSGSGSAAAVGRYSAVAMFNDRARARDPQFALDEASAPHIAAICRRLDGLPLALELAAARMGLLSPAELAERLGDALALLVGGARDAPERQRTLRATLDWSHDLLTRAERQTFARMAVFAGGATLAAAEAVTGAPIDVLDAVVAKQLVVRRGPRLFMLETVREYAAEQLAAALDADTVHDRLALWCLSFMQEATPYLVTAERVNWLAQLDAEYPNVVAALSWVLDAQRAELALQLAGALGAYWWHTNRSPDGVPWLNAALELPGEASARSRATALLYRARLVGQLSPDEFRVDLESALELFRATEDAGGVATCLGQLAIAEARIGHDLEARALRDEALELAQSTDDAAAIASVASIADPSYQDATRHAHAAVPYLQRVGDLFHLAWVCNVTGYLAIVDRNYHDALVWLDQGLDAAQRLSNPKSVFLIRNNQGLAALFLDEIDDASRAFRDALAVCREAGCEDMIEEPLLGLASAIAGHEHYARAAELAGAARAHETNARTAGEETVRARLNDEILTSARDRYGGDDWDRAAGFGATLTAPEAIDLALERGRFAPPTADANETHLPDPIAP